MKTQEEQGTFPGTVSVRDQRVADSLPQWGDQGQLQWRAECREATRGGKRRTHGLAAEEDHAHPQTRGAGEEASSTQRIPTGAVRRRHLHHLLCFPH